MTLKRDIREWLGIPDEQPVEEAVNSPVPLALTKVTLATIGLPSAFPDYLATNPTLPLGRANTYTIVGSDQPANVKAQADAVGNGATDETIINAGKAKVGLSGTLRLFGEFTTSGPLDLTGIYNDLSHQSSFFLDMRGATIIGKGAGKPVMDLSGSFGIRSLGGRVIGDSVNVPNVALQFARVGAGQCGLHMIQGMQVMGEYSGAAMALYGSEGDVFRDCWVHNGHDGAPVYYISPLNGLGLSSDFVAIVSGEQSQRTLLISGGSAEAIGGLTPTAANRCIHFVPGTTADSVIENVAIQDVYLPSLGDSAIYVDHSQGGYIYNVRLMGNRTSDNNPTHWIYMPDAPSARYCDFWTLIGNYLHSTGTEIAIGANVITEHWLMARANRLASVNGLSFYQVTDSELWTYGTTVTSTNGFNDCDIHTDNSANVTGTPNRCRVFGQDQTAHWGNIFQGYTAQ